MSVSVAFDIYPAATPNGTLLVRLTASEAVELTCRKVLHGSGMGSIRIHSDHEDATSANFTKRNYVKVVLINGATETEWFGFFLEEGDFAAVSRKEQGGRFLTFKGPGSLFYLDRAVLLADIYAPGQPRRGNLELDGTWGWNDVPYGAIMTRVMEEGYYAPGNPLFYATWDFSRTEDSAAVAWPNIDNEYTVPWGTKVYDVIANFIKLGLIVTVDADLTFHAWQTYGTNRTSATFAANKIRYEHGVNIGNEVVRQIRASLERSHIFVTGDEFTSEVVSGGSSAVTYYDTIQRQDTNDSATLSAAGTHNLDAREIQADAAFPVRVVIGEDELNGLYVPGEHYDVGDIVSIHTVPPGEAANDHDYDNFAIEVAAIKLEHDDAGNWFAVNELGAQYLVAQMSAFEERSSRIVHQIELCRTGTAPTLIRAAQDHSGTVGGFTTTGEEGEILYAFVQEVPSFPVTLCQWQRPTEPGPPAAENFTFVQRVTNGSAIMSVSRLVNPGVGAGQIVASIGTGSCLIGVYHVTGRVSETVPTNSGTSDTSSLTAAAGSGLLLDVSRGSGAAANAAPSEGGGQTEDWATFNTAGETDIATGGSHGGDNPTWTYAGSLQWVAMGLIISGGSLGDVPQSVGGNSEAAVGTSVRAARCDHVHDHSDLSAHTTEIHHHASSVEVTPFDTIAATTLQAALEEIFDEAAGASDHGALTGLADDDHTQYVLKTLGGKEVVSTVAASGAAETLDLANGNWHDITLTADCTFTFSGATNGVGCSFVLIMRQDGTGGWAPTWPGSVEWPGGVEPEWDLTASAVNIVSFLSNDGGTTWFGMAAGSASSVTEEAVQNAGRWEVIVSGTAPPVAVTNEAEDDWVYGWVSG